MLHIACPGPACVPVVARVVAEAVVLRQRAAAGRASRRRWQRVELRCACGTCVGSWRCLRCPASAAARKLRRDESRRIEERGAISRVVSAASRLSGAHPARSRSARGQQSGPPRPTTQLSPAAQAQDLLRAGLVFFLPWGGEIDGYAHRNASCLRLDVAKPQAT